MIMFIKMINKRNFKLTVFQSMLMKVYRIHTSKEQFSNFLPFFRQSTKPKVKAKGRLTPRGSASSY